MTWAIELEKIIGTMSWKTLKIWKKEIVTGKWSSYLIEFIEGFKC